ncbi:pimeloyl-ACP methyl ester carboxylesterase [Thermocatellispora tengchongensis]|uniref:Pimeloyl-ACP methyl ester carboxylesterase n=2 Tax=Thermocatellispora tengchongensis TaxID=1073253 RepID=A0A840NVK9_9ACTN|nr:alpha/beta hydrolase [Thermocatellispora tengchongensis]MBB5131262.1 pimeloyl-ACP methyl ester carboxylesterase [Thermocatellispora tengchongensis]
MAARRVVAAGAGVCALLTSAAGCEGDDGETGLRTGRDLPGGAVVAGVSFQPAPLAWGPCDAATTSPAERAPATTSPATTSPTTTSPAQPAPTTTGAQPAALECATMRVPLDYDDPGAGTIGIAVIRARATGPGPRIGSLLFNFGGPGASGVDILKQTLGQWRTLNTRYDLVSFDPRGVGASAPVECLDDRQMDASMQSDSSPDDAAEVGMFEAEQRAYVRACQARSGKVLGHVGTVNAARDMELLRTALGDDKLNYFGISYGTWLGGVYAHQFPRSTGRIVLDGAVDTKISTRDLNLQQAAGFERALRSYAEACAKRGATDCPPSKGDKSAEAIISDIRAFLEGLDAKPIRTSQGRPLSQTLGVSGVATALYSKQLWPVLSQGLTMAYEGDGTVLLSLADAQNGRREDGTYTNLNAANTAIKCDDTTERYTVSDVEAALPRFRRASAVFGPLLAWNLMQCTGWPFPGDDEAKEVSAPGSAPIVVLGNTGDPATPYAWAPALARELGNARLVTLHGEGHGSYDTGDPCVVKAVDDFLLQGKVPADGTRCP